MNTASNHVESLEHALEGVTRLLTGRALSVRIARACGYHLTGTSWTLLEYLDQHGGLSVSQIAACQGVDVSTVTPRLQRMEANGLVRRERRAEDRRSSQISITPRGSQALRTARATRQEVLAAALADLPAADLDIATRTIAIVEQRLTAGELAPHPPS